MSARRRPVRVVGVLWAVALSACWSSAGSAQTPGRAAHVALGGGLSLGGTGGATVVLPSPVTLDAGATFWNSERPSVVYGLSGRVELTGRTSLGVVPRVALQRDYGFLSVRPSVGLPFFLAPFSMLGVEGAVTGRVALGGRLWLWARFAVDAYFWGSDLPRDTTVVMVNGFAGVELAI